MPQVDLNVEPFKNHLPQDQVDKWAVCRSYANEFTFKFDTNCISETWAWAASNRIYI